MRKIDENRLELIYSDTTGNVHEEVWHDPLSGRNRIISQFNEEPYANVVKDAMSRKYTGKENTFFIGKKEQEMNVIASIPKWIAEHFDFLMDPDRQNEFFKWLDGPGRKWKTKPVSWTSTTAKNKLFTGFSG